MPPFNPGVAAGTLNNNAGSYSPFYLHLTRTDAEQEITGFSTAAAGRGDREPDGRPVLPRGGHRAREDQDRCQGGNRTVVSSSEPDRAHPRRYRCRRGARLHPWQAVLAGPSKGDPFSLVSVTSARVGPFDLGTVVLRIRAADRSGHRHR